MLPAIQAKLDYLLRTVERLLARDASGERHATRILNVELDGNLAVDGNAQATVLDWNGTADVNSAKTITVYSWGGAKADVGTKLLAIYRPVRKRYESLSADPGAGVSLCRVTVATKDANGLYPGKLVTVAAAADFDAYTSFVDGPEIWIATLLSDPMLVVTGIPRFYFASLIGQATSAAATRPLYLLRDEQTTTRWTPFQNVGSFTIPAWGACVSKGHVVNPGTGQILLRLDRPTATYERQLFINAPVSVAPNGYGICTMDWPAPAIPEGFTVVDGDSLGQAKDSFSLRKNHPGFRAKSTDLGGVVWVVTDNEGVVWCRATTGSPGEPVAIPQGESAEVQVWARSGVNAFDTQLRITVVNETGRDIRRDEFFLATFACGAWRIIPHATGIAMIQFVISAGATLQGTVTDTSDASRYPLLSNVTLSNPHGWAIAEYGQTGEAVDHGNGLAKIISITCVPAVP